MFLKLKKKKKKEVSKKWKTFRCGHDIFRRDISTWFLNYNKIEHYFTIIIFFKTILAMFVLLGDGK